MLSSMIQTLSNRYYFGAFNLNALDAQGNTALVNACENKQWKLVWELLKAGADPNVGEGKLALHYAAEQGDYDLVNFLIRRYKAEVDANNPYDGSTPLHLASAKKHSQIASLLVLNGASIDATNQLLQTPVEIAVFNEAHEVVKYFLGIPESSSFVLKKLVDLTESAIADGNLLLLKKLMCFKIRFHVHKNLKQYLEKAHDQSIIDCLNEYNKSLVTRLFSAIQYFGVKEVAELLDAGVGIDVHGDFEDYEDVTPLHVAVIKTLKPDVIKLLIKRGASLEARDKSGKTPLMIADSEKVKYLLKIPEAANHPGVGKFLASSESESLNHCIEKGDLEFLELLLKFEEVRSKILQNIDQFISKAGGKNKATIVDRLKKISGDNMAPVTMALENLSLEDGQDGSAKKLRFR